MIKVDVKALLIMLVLFFSLKVDFILAEDKVLQLVEIDTGITGWRYQGQCRSKKNSSISYEIDYFSPPSRVDVGGYGVLKIKHDGQEVSYKGYDL